MSNDERPPERVYERLPRLARLGESGRAVARELVEWREGIAESMDRPAGFVLPDQALMELARRAPTDANGLEQIRGLPPQTLHRRGDQLIAAIAPRARARAAAAPATPPSRDSGDAPLVSLAQALVRQRSMRERRGRGADRHPVRAGRARDGGPARRGRRRACA